MHTQFDDIQYAKLRRSLIRKSAKGTPAQREFLSAARDSAKFLDYMSDAVGLQEGIELEPLADRMSEAEFGNPPSDTEHRLYLAWRDLTPRLACRTAFWGRVTYRHIEEGKIESSFLAVNGGGNVTGAQRIDAALAARGEKATRLLDGCVRSVLRRLGGLPEARGNRSVYVNCPLARAWWRERLVAEVVRDAGKDIEQQVRRVLHPETLQYWEEMVTFVVSRNSVFGSLAVRNIVIRALAAIISENPRSPLRTAQELKRVCRAVSSIQASVELSVLPQEQVQAIIGDIINPRLRE